MVALPLAAAAAVDFATGVKPVLEKHCVSCHNAERAYGQVRVDTREALMGGKSLWQARPRRARSTRR